MTDTWAALIIAQAAIDVAVIVGLFGLNARLEKLEGDRRPDGEGD